MRLRKRYGRWTVIGREVRDVHGIRHVPAKCDCGVRRCVAVRSLETGKSKSCGCWRKEVLKTLYQTHGQTKSKLYKVWAGMIQRCTNSKHVGYKNYGGRGIKVWNQWRRFESFSDWAKTAGYKEGLTLDRIDNSRNYCLSNCRWVSRLIQANNRRKKPWCGVSFHKATGKFQAYYSYGPPGQRLRDYLGLYVTKEAARRAVIRRRALK